MKLTSPDQQIRITRTGLEITADLTFEEWKAMAPRFGAAMASAAFAIGDWLVYGEDTFRGQMRLPGFKDEDHSSGRIASDVYDAALASTGLDRSTLATYAYVSRNVPRSLRNEQLSWEHHKAVARLNETDQERWLQVAVAHQDDSGPVSTRRLRKSIIVGRLLSAEELHPDPTDRGLTNHIPFVNRLVAWWSQMRDKHWLDHATRDQRAALKRDLHPVIEIYNQL